MTKPGIFLGWIRREQYQTKIILPEYDINFQTDSNIDDDYWTRRNHPSHAESDFKILQTPFAKIACCHK